VLRAVPKDGSAVFNSFPDFDDSARALLGAALAAHPRVTVIVGGDPTPPAWVPPGVEVRRWRSLGGLIRYLRASVVYTTHGLYGMVGPVPSQLVVNLWHGMPIKRIDRAIGGKPWPFSFSIATSEHFADILADSFEVPRQDLLAIGLPRNDLLVTELPDHGVVAAELGAPRYLVMLPTFRVMRIGLAREDGTDDSLAVVDADRDRLEEVLARHDLRLLVKPHPATPAGALDSWRSDRILLIDDAWLRRRDLTLYGLLGGAVGLITDYSSVAVDFLATSRPCFLYQPDRSSYEEHRGLATAPEILATIGPAVHDIPALAAAIDRAARAGFVRDAPVAPELWSVPLDGATGRVLDAVAARQRGRNTIQRPT
jgi:CDP-glycerol glycerophosphotransferase (TagB/SpsB family)